MSEPMPTDDAGEPRIGIPRQIRERIMRYACVYANLNDAFLWLEEHTYPVDPPWVPDPDAIEALDASSIASVALRSSASWPYAADRLKRLHDAGWELVRTEAPR